MNDAKFCIENDKIFVKLPLTSPTGKVRIKERNSFYEYGIHFMNMEFLSLFVKLPSL